MFARFPNKPNKNKPKDNCNAVVAKPKLARQKTYIIKEKTKMRWLPNLVTIFPEKGMMANCPIGSAKSIDPKSPSVKCKAVLISGIRLAQVAKLKPIPK
ncbi:hypothetical protein D3C85_877130 [compost metagenome]